MMHYSDTAIIEGIRMRDRGILGYTYAHYYPMVRYFIIRNHGCDMDAQDIFQEAIVAIYEKTRKKKIVLHCSFKTYLYSVCRHLWLQSMDRSNLFIPVDDLDEFLVLEDKIGYEEELQLRKRIYQRNFLQLSDKCQRILYMYMERVPFEKITQEMSYKSVQYTIKRKFECFKSLITRIRNDSEYKNLF
jgi:RNA polymerase sigma factor (sigma-70 family)